MHVSGTLDWMICLRERRHLPRLMCTTLDIYFEKSELPSTLQCIPAVHPFNCSDWRWSRRLKASYCKDAVLSAARPLGRQRPIDSIPGAGLVESTKKKPQANRIPHRMNCSNDVIEGLKGSVLCTPQDRQPASIWSWWRRNSIFPGKGDEPNWYGIYRRFFGSHG
ncbi:hypothetical protein BJV82DRAFT_197979 [Fennellomyces sp. T-0311]|nr:hypothetical protein BJV82DRAFT_197979 [Fennellomyces sp. T-0311]